MHADHSVVHRVLAAARPSSAARPFPLFCVRFRGYFGLARTSARPLARYDRAPHEQFSAPDAPGLPAIECSRQAGDPGPALPAHRLRLLHVLWRLGEEQLRILRARKIQTYRERGSGNFIRSCRHELIRHTDLAGLADVSDLDLPDVLLLPYRRAERLEPRRVPASDGGSAPLHRCHPLSLTGPSCRPCDFSPVLGPRPLIAKAADPVFGSAASRGCAPGLSRPVPYMEADPMRLRRRRKHWSCGCSY